MLTKESANNGWENISAACEGLSACAQRINRLAELVGNMSKIQRTALKNPAGRLKKRR